MWSLLWPEENVGSAIGLRERLRSSFLFSYLSSSYSTFASVPLSVLRKLNKSKINMICVLYLPKYLIFHLHIVWKSLKMLHLQFFPPIFVLLKLTCLITLFDRKLQVFKNLPKWTIFGIFNQLLSAQNVNLVRFARNVEWDFFCDFQTPCHCDGVAILSHILRQQWFFNVTLEE